MSPLYLLLPACLLASACAPVSTPSALAAYVEQVDARAAVQSASYRNHKGQVAAHAYIHEGDSHNALYTENGTLLYAGGPSSQEELVFLSPTRVPRRVTAVENAKGSYVAFTPESVYVMDFDGNRHGQYERRATALPFPGFVVN